MRRSRKERAPATSGLPTATPARSEQEIAKRQLQQIQISLPQPHMHMLRKEADLIGVSRGALLGMILRKRRLGFQFQRPPGAPSYDFKPKEFEKTERFTWYVTRDERKMLDEDTLLMGNMTISAWVITVMNQYIGRNV